MSCPIFQHFPIPLIRPRYGLRPFKLPKQNPNRPPFWGRSPPPGRKPLEELSQKGVRNYAEIHFCFRRESPSVLLPKEGFFFIRPLIASNTTGLPEILNPNSTKQAGFSLRKISRFPNRGENRIARKNAPKTPRNRPVGCRVKIPIRGQFEPGWVAGECSPP
jgi:hypothetical protein